MQRRSLVLVVALAAGACGRGFTSPPSVDDAEVTGSVTIVGALADGTPSTTLTSTVGVTLQLEASSSISGTAVTGMELSASSGFVGAAWQPFATQASWVLSAGDGTKTVYARFRTGTDSQSSTASASIALDTTATRAATISVAATDPLAEPGFVSGADGGQAISVALTADDGPVSLRLSVGGDDAGWEAAPPGPQPWTLTRQAPAGLEGLLAVTVRFRDAAGNESADFSASLAELTQGPVAEIGLSTSSAFISSATVTVQLEAPANSRYRLSCDGTALDAEPLVPFTSSATCLLPPGDGPETIQAEFIDPADNATLATPLDIQMLRTPPTAPVLLMQAANDADAGVVTVITGPNSAITSASIFTVLAVDAGSTSPSFSHLVASGGTSEQVDGGTVSFGLVAGSNFGDAQNVLQVSAVDAAGNVGPPSSVVITQQSSRPGVWQPDAPVAPVALVARSQSVQVTWAASDSKFATGYQLDYGVTPAFGGTLANEGVSPLSVGSPCDASGTCRFVLTGLPNFEPVYVGVRALSPLGSGAETGGNPVTPQVVNLSMLGSAPLADTAHALVAEDDLAYVLEASGVEIVDLADVTAPHVLSRSSFDAPRSQIARALAVRWPYAYAVGGDGLYVLDVRDPANPIRVSKSSANVGINRGLALRFPYAYANEAYPDGGTDLNLLNVSDAGGAATLAQVPGPRSAAPYIGGLALAGDTVFFESYNWGLALARLDGGASTPVFDGKEYDSDDLYGAYDLLIEPAPRELVYTYGSVGPTITVREVLADGGGMSLLSSITTEGQTGAMAITGADLFWANSTLHAVTMGDPTAPNELGTLDLGGNLAAAVAIDGSKILVAGNSSLQIIEAAHTQYPVRLSRSALLNSQQLGARVVIDGRMTWVSDDGFTGFDVSDPTAPVTAFTTANNVLGHSARATSVGGLVGDGDLFFTSAYGNQDFGGQTYQAVWAYSQAGRQDGGARCGPGGCFPCVVGGYSTVSTATTDLVPAGVSRYGGYLYAAAGSSGAIDGGELEIIDDANIDPLGTCWGLNGLVPPVAVPTVRVPTAAARDVQFSRGRAYVAENGGFEIFDVSQPLAPVSLSRHDGEVGVSQISVRAEPCGTVDCTEIFLATANGVRVFQDAPSGIVDLGTLASGLPVASVLASHDALFAGADSIVSGSVFAPGSVLTFDVDAAWPSPLVSTALPIEGSGVSAFGLGGRYLYVGDGDSLIIDELQ